ncbi:sensor histidine kinase [Thermocoleostomius sinensis]|uniref:histidine kinase n=1 Tax=Thermocoleostomius sinensis A174 TaxID=2016057 RepID=A0A9E8Z8V2_9CYAN|nr:GAF domain-containing protein [Thermocoleostomius sinensis]WAL58447.1 GAF domain-containing protein [Thermocoleostomius sinensis A174]
MDELFVPRGQTVIALQKQLNLLDHIPVGACVVRRDGTVLFWNACLENWTHISRAQIVGRKLDHYFPHLSQPKYTRRFQETFDGGFTIIFSAQLHPHLMPCQCANGQLRVQHTIVTAIPAASGIGFDALMSIQDVSDLTQQIQNYKQIQARAWTEVKQRQSIEEQLRTDRDLLNTILNNSAAAIIMTTTEGAIVFANRRGEDILRLLKSGVPGQAYSPPQWQVTDFAGNRLSEEPLPVAQVMAAGKAVFDLQRCWEWADGTRCFLSINAAPLWHNQPDDQITHLVFSISDITLQQHAAIELQHRYDKDRLVDQIALHIRQSLNLRDILQTTVSEIRTFLGADRVLIYRLDSTEGHGRVVAEACHPDFPSLLEWSRRSDFMAANDDDFAWLDPYRHPVIQAIDDIQQSGLNPNYINLLQRFSVKARLAIPVFLSRDILPSHGRSKQDLTSTLWGWVIVHQCQDIRHWQSREIELLQRLENQLAVAIHQSELLQQVHHLNINLERQVHARTLELQQALTLEATLKRITDKVRDSLDENQILQSVVRELGEALEVHYCNTTLYGSNSTTPNLPGIHSNRCIATNVSIQHQYSSPNIPRSSEYNHQLQVEELFNIYDQLFRGQPVVFCQLAVRSPAISQSLHDYPHLSAILACPIVDDQGVLGDLWLFRVSASSFSDREIRLVQQVANQCAIAIRQAQLYKRSEQKVEELAQLNHLKDDFLNTISHELRTPIVSIRMTLQTLEILFKRSDGLQDLKQAHHYFHILEDECKREVNLIDNLLDLTRMEAGTEPLVYTSVNPKNWIPHVAEGFERRMQLQQQHLQFNLPDDLPTLVTDLTILERILTELLNNAYKYTPAGETITIAAQVEAERFPGQHQDKRGCRAQLPNQWNHENGMPGHFSTSLSANLTDPSRPTAKLAFVTPTLPQFRISITNTGIEIPRADLDRVFDKFYRVPGIDARQTGGTGLGLALVKRMVEYLGGRIWAESEQNYTRFVLELALVGESGQP